MYLYVLVHTPGGPDPHQAHSRLQEHTSLTVLEALPHRGTNHENLIHNAIRICLFMTLTYTFIPVYTSMNWYVVCTGMYWYVPVAGMYWYVLVCTDIYLLVLVYTGMYQYT